MAVGFLDPAAVECHQPEAAVGQVHHHAHQPADDQRLLIVVLQNGAACDDIGFFIYSVIEKQYTIV